MLYSTQELIGTGLLGLAFHNAPVATPTSTGRSPRWTIYRTMALFTAGLQYRRMDSACYRQGTRKKPRYRELQDISAAEAKQIDDHRDCVAKQIEPLQKSLNELRGNYQSRLRRKNSPKFEANRAALRPRSIRLTISGMQSKSIFPKNSGWHQGDSGRNHRRAMNDDDRKTDDSLGQRITALNATMKTYGSIQAMYNSGHPPVTRSLKRGNYLTPIGRVKTRFLSVLDDPDDPGVVPPPIGNAPTSGRRLAFAQWLSRS